MKYVKVTITQVANEMLAILSAEQGATLAKGTARQLGGGQVEVELDEEVLGVLVSRAIIQLAEEKKA